MENEGKYLKPNYILLTREVTSALRIYNRLQVRRWEKILHANINRNQKRAGVAILILDKIVLKTAVRDKKGNYVMIKGSI